MATIPRRSGVYQITCMPTGHVYVGRTVNLLTRWREHTRQLRIGKHGNRHLQAAWNMFEPDDFRFSILEFAGEAGLVAIEQKWIDQTDCLNPETGFNISDNAAYPSGMHAHVWEGFIDPDGNEVTITNLSAFCREHGLSLPVMVALANPNKKHKGHKGWSHRNSVRQRDYIKTHAGFINPDGNPVEPIVNMAEFCREHGLDNGHMIAVANGRILSHKGWTHINSRPRQNGPKTYTGFVNPVGERVIITNLQEFCKEHGLHIIKMRQVKCGIHRSHKGWTWREQTDDISAE